MCVIFPMWVKKFLRSQADESLGDIGIGVPGKGELKALCQGSWVLCCVCQSFLGKPQYWGMWFGGQKGLYGWGCSCPFLLPWTSGLLEESAWMFQTVLKKLHYFFFSACPQQLCNGLALSSGTAWVWGHYSWDTNPGLQIFGCSAVF